MKRMRPLSALLRSLLLLAASVAWAAQAQAPMPPDAASPLSAPGAGERARVMLLLPSQSTVFARAAEALREGFLAAHKVGGEDVAVEVVEAADSIYMAELLEAGKVAPVIEKCYPLNEAPAVMRFLLKDTPKEKSLSQWNLAI